MLLEQKTTLPSLRTIAERAGVSVATASRVLNRSKQSERVAVEIASKVTTVAREMGYNTSYLRRAIRTGQTETLGLVVDVNGPRLPGENHADSFMTNHYFAKITAGVEQAAHEVGFNLSIVVPSRTQRAGVRGFEQLQDGRFDGLVIGPALHPTAYHILSDAPLLPLVVTEPAIETDLPCVSQDESRNMEVAIHHLTELGHRSILWFGPGRAQSVAKRENIFLSVIVGRRLQGAVCHYAELVPSDPASADKAARAREESLDQFLGQPGNNFTAVVAYNDHAAISAARSLIRAGKRIPQDVSVIGFDNLDPNMNVLPLTTIDQRFDEIGRRAGEIALEMATGGSEACKQWRGKKERVGPVLIVRETTGKAPDHTS